MSVEPSLAEAGVGGLMLLATVAYGVLGGADFGGGIWDALAAGPRRDEQRAAVSRAMGPVWEANHVWLIFVIVLLFAGFPAAYARLSVELFTPFHLVLLGIILRGAAFVFRGYVPEQRHGPSSAGAARRFGAVFSAASLLTPLLLGMCVGAISVGGGAGRGLPWLSPVAVAIGVLAVASCSYLAAVYLANETSGALREDFRRRALWSGGAVALLSVAALPVLREGAPQLWRGLLHPLAWPVLGLGAASAVASGWFLLRRRFRRARAATILQVGGLIVGWGIAQYPHLIHPDLTLSAAAAPEPMLRFLLWSTPFGMALLVPSLAYLLRVFKTR